jgi:hypothetical protein
MVLIRSPSRVPCVASVSISMTTTKLRCWKTRCLSATKYQNATRVIDTEPNMTA